MVSWCYIKGPVVWRWAAEHYEFTNPHILFSVSKSITAILAGIAEDNGWLECERAIADYLPQVAGSVYEHCTIRHLLDMTVALNFEENYTDPESEYMRYREATAWNPPTREGAELGLEAFLYSLKQLPEEHGQRFLYRSPNSDMLGLVIERAGGKPLAELLSECLWGPLGACTDGNITLDCKELARAAGGISTTVFDLARIGQMILDRGQAGSRQVVSERWVMDTRYNGDKAAWDAGNYAHKFPRGKYRNKWYQAGDADETICARGIHGQLLYINPARSVIVAKLASQSAPLDDVMTAKLLVACDQISKELAPAT